jgi:hypothetical protein
VSVQLLTHRSFPCRRALVALAMTTGLSVCGIAIRATAATSATAADTDRGSTDEEASGRARRFAEQHHPELARLLDQLRDNSPEQHAKALQELSRAQEQLERTKARNPDRYEAALEQWKLSSRIRLTVARMSLTKDPALEAELRELVKARRALQLLPLRAEQERLEKRLEKVRTELAAYDADPVQAVEREMVELQKNVRAAEAKVKLRRPAAGKKD